MEILIDKLPDSDEDCSYIHGNIFSVEQFLYRDYSEEALDFLFSFGIRHFGSYFFRPVCRECSSCLPLRIRIQGVNFSKSQKRIINQNKHIEIKTVQDASHENFEIYKNHKTRFSENFSENFSVFQQSFNYLNPNSYIDNYYLESKLITSSHYDISTEAISAVYTYYDTDYQKLSLGTYAVLNLIRKAISLNKKYLYLGYYIKENKHMNYKKKFFPNQLLINGKWNTFINDKRDLTS